MARLPELLLAALPERTERCAGLALPGCLHELREDAAVTWLLLALLVLMLPFAIVGALVVWVYLAEAGW